LITGPTTGAKEMEVTEMMVNDVKSDKGSKGDLVTIPMEFRIRPSDKLYKIVENKVEASW
ncbi:MAG TPA: collagenase-like protease, partial [Xanthomarina gelatinilytica]|nr:collagenase-like protease [Xanthomarina gelatinilytica]